MADGIEFDFSELRKLSADLGELAVETPNNVRKAVEVTARNVKDSWRDEAKKSDRSGSMKRYPQAISYDVKKSDGEIEAEIGPELGKGQGSFGAIEETGLKYRGVGIAPRGNARRALKANIEDFERGINKAAGDLS